MNANASRSRADQTLESSAGLAPFETWMSINGPMLEAMTELNGRLIEQMSRANTEWIDFVSRRWNEDMAASKRLLECRTVEDLFTAYTEFVQRAQQQYQAEFQYFARLNRKIADETASVLKAHVPEVEADTRH